MSLGWRVMVMPGNPDGTLVGNATDAERQFKLHAYIDSVIRAEAAVVAAAKILKVELEHARQFGQEALADEALRLLSARRAAAIEG